MPKLGTEKATIDVSMVVIKTKGANPQEIAVTTASKVGVEAQIETTDAVKKIIKGVMKAQKPEVNTITGHKITLTDNVFIPEVVKTLQGGTIKYDPNDSTKVIGYTPPVAGSSEKGEVFDLYCYSAHYNAAGIIEEYERIWYPNGQGKPIAMSSEDGVFRVSEYTINSAPNTGEPPYDIDYVDELPEISSIRILSLAATAGSTATKTKVTVLPAPASGETAKYKLAKTLPTYDEALTTGWSAFTASTDITCADGDEIVVAYVDTSNKCKAAGKTAVVVGP